MTGRLPLTLAAISVVALMLWFNLPRRGHHSPKLQNTVRSALLSESALQIQSSTPLMDEQSGCQICGESRVC